MLDALPEALLCDLDQPQGLFAHLPAGKGGGAVAVEAIDEGAHVYADNVAFFQLAMGRDSMNHFVIHGNAGAAREAAIS